MVTSDTGGSNRGKAVLLDKRYNQTPTLSISSHLYVWDHTTNPNFQKRICSCRFSSTGYRCPRICSPFPLLTRVILLPKMSIQGPCAFFLKILVVVAILTQSLWKYLHDFFLSSVLHMHMYVCMYVYMYVHMYIHIHTCIYVSVCVWMYVCVSWYECIYALTAYQSKNIND